MEWKNAGWWLFPRVCTRRKKPQPTKIAALSIFVYNSSFIAGTIGEDDYKDNEGIGDGMKGCDSLLGRQAVTLSPPVCRELTLLARVDDTNEM